MREEGQPAKSTPSTGGGGAATGPGSSYASPQAPVIALPKGGGAIRGIGEKFAANPVTGTGSMSVPIATSPGRSGFGPQLSLSYDSGAGNGPFGFGWSLSLPQITRKTDKGLPQYNDAEDSDVFLLSGAEDLVPVLIQKARDKWSRENVPARTVNGVIYRVDRYRPRIEGLFARIERWMNPRKPEETFWRSISKDNITTWYGKTAESRISDPADPQRIFSWLICESYDDKGNLIVYRYAEENDANVDQTRANERNHVRTANRYPKRIQYGNRTPYFPVLDATAPWPLLPDNDNWCFKVVFDYDEDHVYNETTDSEQQKFVEAGITAAKDWTFRNDAFSSYRAGFEIRTTRLCQHVLMFHHFPGEAGVDANCLVRSTDFTYSYEQDPNNARNPIYSFLLSVTQTGYKRLAGRYACKSLPPTEFEYSVPIVQDIVREVDTESLNHLPIGLDGAAYQWIDLHGEGVPGILSEQAGVWFYKRNLSPVNITRRNGAETAEAKFAPLELVATKPNLAVGNGAQFMDLAGDGQPDLVVLDGPMPGLYEHDDSESWHIFRPFIARLNRDTRDPNLKFVDLDGDGHADVLITEHNAFIWHNSEAEAGFGPARRAFQDLDEEKGPRLVFGDGTQSIYLADMSGDGLTDLVRIRNGEVCYWPNLGYCRFGAKVTMDNAPLFDRSDQFDQRRIRLADIDGSGTTDIIYLHRDGVHLYFNQSGNSWSAPRPLQVFPRVDDLVSIMPIDLLGNGTACLVWSSPLPGDARRPVRYVALMQDKPHLLIKTRNNLGAETEVQYAPSTKFYLADKLSGKPWATRLPFPVHCIEKLIISDKWRKTRFSTTYTYHHGYFDGEEREFRGFGRVEQVDVDSFGEFFEGNQDSPYITNDKTLYQPPVKTISWFHLGIAANRAHILSSYAQEFFPTWFEDLAPSSSNVLRGFQENALPEPDLQALALSAEEWREAMRACKGMLLRQEIYELDVDVLERGKHTPVRLFTTAYHNCHIRCLQPRAYNQHAVFLVTESEAITYHYELSLLDSTVEPDPRIAHTLNLNIDEHGNVLQSVAVVYPRREPFDDKDLQKYLQVTDVQRIQDVQDEQHIAYTENRFTEDVLDVDTYRLRVSYEVLTYELTGFSPEDSEDRRTADPRDNRYFTLEELRVYQLSLIHQQSGIPVEELAYHQQPDHNIPQMRLIENVRTLYYKDDLSGPLPLREHGQLGLMYEQYKLALTDDLLAAVFDSKLNQSISARIGTAQDLIENATISGYMSGALLAQRFGRLGPGEYWMRSGVAGFAKDAPQHFYLPERYTDPFDNVTTLAYDGYDLLVASSTDPRGNKTEVRQFDYRVLTPREVKDLNDNLTEAWFDILGLVVAIALKGKGAEGDNLVGFDDTLANPNIGDLNTFFNGQNFSERQARLWLGNATTRHVYHFGEVLDRRGEVVWDDHPAEACTIQREQHVAQLAPGARSPLQVAFECSDGLGTVLMKKSQAEPLPGQSGRRWITSGKTVLNNKGKPVKQYEPYFSDNEHRCEEPLEAGVTPVMYYDAIGRLVRTELPDGTFSRVMFSPWHVASYDQNDTIRESAWFAQRNPPDPDKRLPTRATSEERAAWLAAQHANTPALTFLDSLGRDIVSIAHNRSGPPGARVEEKYLTFTRLDAEGKPLWVRDARGNLVMQYILPRKANNDPSDEMPYRIDAAMGTRIYSTPCYDIAGNLLFQHSMDAGERWMLMDAAGKPMLAWDSNEFQGTGSNIVLQERLFFTEYDALHRPVAQWLSINGGAPDMVERFEYVDQVNSTANNKTNNLLGQAVRHYDPSGLTELVRRDFKGNTEEIKRQLTNKYSAAVIDWQSSRQSKLENEVYAQITTYDALNRMTRQVNWHRVGGSQAVYEPSYNQRGLLVSETLHVGATRRRSTQVIMEIRYNAKGQKELLKLGNRTTTRYYYDPRTFRLRQLRTSRPNYDPSFPTRHSGLNDPNILQQLNYTYDPVGNIVEIYDEAYEPVYFQNQRVEPRSQYEYDALYRLIAASGREHATQRGAPTQYEGPPDRVIFPVMTANTLRNYSEEYQYDSVGNILRMRHTAGSNGSWTRYYDYAATSNRLLHTWEGDPSWNSSRAINKTTYQYDTHGNMRNLADVAPTQYMRWDYRDMIGSLNLQGGGSAYYNYDASKQRTRKRLERRGRTIVEDRIYLGGYERYRKYDQGDMVEEIETHHLFEGEQRVLLVDDVLKTNNANLPIDSLFRYQYSNHLGSACAELNQQAGIISYEEYHPYGTNAYQAMKSNVEVPYKRYRYTGKERDPESGLSNHGARYYAPWMGRWASCDPMGVVDGPNVYAYVSDDPLNKKDVTGNQGVHDQDLMTNMMWDQMGNELSAHIESIFGGRAYVSPRANRVDYSSPQGGVGGLVGGGVRAATLRAVPIEEHPSISSLVGMEVGAGGLPLVGSLDSAARLVTGTTVTGRDTSRLWALAQLALDVLPLALEYRAMRIEARTMSAATQEAKTSVSLAFEPGLAQNPKQQLGHILVGVNSEGTTKWSDLRFSTRTGQAKVRSLDIPPSTGHIVIEIPVSQAKAARAAAVQGSQLANHGQVGLYARGTLDCTTHARDVLTAAGVWTPKVTTPALQTAAVALQSPIAISPLRAAASVSWTASTVVRVTQLEQQLQMSLPSEHR